jgi:undecaprenyl-diphosphatase
VTPEAPDRPGRGFDHPVVSGVDRAGERVAASARGRHGVDRVLYLLSEAGNHSVLWHTVNLADAIGGSVLAGAVAGRRGGDAARTRRVHAARAVRRSVVLGAEQALVNGVVKSLFRRVRPDHVEDHPHDLRTPLTSSFPSGHASAGACAAVLLSRDLGAPVAWWALASAVAWSRIHVGAHHTSDVLGGAALGAGLAALAGRVWPPPS